MIEKVFLKVLSLYQKLAAFIWETVFCLPSQCRFQPSCSEYLRQAVVNYGILKGSWLGLKRIIRCHPWSEGGWDGLV